MSYDVKCDTLARAFLSDVDKQDDETVVKELAQQIQNAIEDFFAARELET